MKANERELAPANRPELIEYVHINGAKDLLDSQTRAGEGFRVKYNAYNVGFAPARDLTISFYLSRDRHIRSTDTPLETLGLTSFGAGAIGLWDATLTVPADQPPGSYYVGYILGSATQEYTPGNNAVVIDERLRVSASAAPPNLVGSLQVSNDTVTPGQSFTLSLTVAMKEGRTTAARCHCGTGAAGMAGTLPALVFVFHVSLAAPAGDSRSN